MSRLKSLAALAAVALTACGGGTVQPTPAPESKYALIAYIGDDLVALGCSASYNAPLPSFLTDTPNATCSAVQGETNAQTLARLPAVLAQHPKVIVILAGENDVRSGETSTAVIVEMVIEAQSHGVIVILCTLPTSAGFDAEIQIWNASIRQIAQAYGTQLADLYAGMADPGSLPDVVQYAPWLETAQLMDSAGEYPNANGFLVIWDTLCLSTDKDGIEAP